MDVPTSQSPCPPLSNCRAVGFARRAPRAIHTCNWRKDMTGPLSIDPRSSALLVMDYQIDILEKFMASADPIEVLSVLPKLLAAARSAGMLVIYVIASFRPGYPEVSPRNPGFSFLAQSGLLQATSPGTQIHPAVAPIERE